MGWTDLGSVSQIAAATTTLGKTISNLTVFNGRLFLGHGDYTNNTPNPSHLMAYEPGTGFVDFGAVNSVSLLDMAVIGSQLAIPFTDPSLGSFPAAAFLHSDDTLETLDGSALFAPRAWHVYGAALFGGVRYLSGGSVNGSTAQYAVWADRSTGWSNPSTFAGNSYAGSSCDECRIYGLFVLGSTLYAARPSSQFLRTTDGATWTSGSPTTPWRMKKPFVVGSYCYYGSGDPGWQSGPLDRFDGTSKVNMLSNVWDHTLDGNGNVVGLRATDLAVVDLSNTVVLSTTPTNARSIAWFNGTWYAGTNNAHLWRYDALPDHLVTDSVGNPVTDSSGNYVVSQ